MDASGAELPSWEQVLAAVEDDARRTAELLRSDALTPAAPDGAGGVPGDWFVPGLDWGELPPIEQMPAVPEELRERIVALQGQLQSLQDEISAELDAYRSRFAAPTAASTAEKAAASGLPVGFTTLGSSALVPSRVVAGRPAGTSAANAKFVDHKI